jgi:predicted DNA-binding protein YlxM (UPF0122 family)
MSWNELQKERNRNLIKRYRDNIIRDYFSNGLSVTEIHYKYGVTKYSIEVLIREHKEFLKNNQEVIYIPRSKRGRPPKESKTTDQIPAD